MDDLSHDAFLAFDARFDPDAQRFHPSQQHHHHHPSYLSPASASTWPLPLAHHDDMSQANMHNSTGNSDSNNAASSSTVASPDLVARSHTLPSPSMSDSAIATTALASRPVTSTAPPLRTAGLGYQTTLDPSAALLTSAEWQFPLQAHAGQQAYLHDHSLDASYAGTFGMPLQTSPIDFISTSPGTQAMPLANSLSVEPATSYLAFTTSIDPMATMATMAPYQMMSDFTSELSFFPLADGLPTSTAVTAADYLPAHMPSTMPDSSPEEAWLDHRSISGSSENSWTLIDYLPPSRQSFDSDSNGISPLALHIRTDSHSTNGSSDAPPSASSWEDLQFPFHSPGPELPIDITQGAPNGLPLIASYPIQGVSEVMPLTTSSSPSSASPASSGGNSPVLQRRRKSPVSPTGVTAKIIAKPKGKSASAASTAAAAAAAVTGGKKEGASEKKVGRRKGPLRPDQRQQAHEIRKLRACLRCKFLKKVCDKGSPCGGCQPSHQRLWQVPCTRIDIKDIGYFLKDWKADYERHVSLGFSVGNIKGFSHHERTIFVTHGYGFYFPISAREVYVRDEKCFGVDWVESIHVAPRAYEVVTAKLSAGINGVAQDVLSEYLDRYIDNGFETFVDQYFEGTMFLSEMLKTVHRYWVKSQLPVIRKALRMVLAYNLTLHITMVEGLSEEEAQVGKIDDEGSRFSGKTCAPVMINFQVKCALAEMWRNLMKEILEELSALYSSVYSGEKLKNWPTIFMLAIVLLLIWEEMQFDCHYRVPDQDAVKKFCTEMESTPVGVVVGLFQAMSTKLPTFMEWDSRKHHHVLHSNQPICDAMTEVRAHVTKYGEFFPSLLFERVPD